MNKPYQEISLLEFQTKYQTEEDCEKGSLISAGHKDLLVPVAGIKNITMLLSVNCISAKNVGIRHL